jgi:hypothetical protein
MSSCLTVFPDAATDEIEMNLIPVVDYSHYVSWEPSQQVVLHITHATFLSLYVEIHHNNLNPSFPRDD